MKTSLLAPKKVLKKFSTQLLNSTVNANILQLRYSFTKKANSHKTAQHTLPSSYFLETKVFRTKSLTLRQDLPLNLRSFESHGSISPLPGTFLNNRNCDILDITMSRSSWLHGRWTTTKQCNRPATIKKSNYKENDEFTTQNGKN